VYRSPIDVGEDHLATGARDGDHGRDGGQALVMTSPWANAAEQR
jgi:hypothetical protein